MPPISSSDARDAAREAALESIVKNAPQRGRAALPYAHGGAQQQHAGPARSLGTPGLTPAHEMRRSNTSFPGAGRGGPPRNASFDAAAVAGGLGVPPMKRCASLSLRNDDIPRRSPSGGPPVLGVRIAPLGGRRPSGHSPNGLPPKSPFKEAPASPLLSAGRGVVATPPATPPNVKERVGSGRGMRMVAPPSSPPPPQHHGKTRAAPPPSPIQDLPRHVSSRASPAHLQQLRPVVPSSPATSGTSRSPSQHPPSPQQPPSPQTRQEEAPVMVPPPSPPGHLFDRSSTQSTRGRNAAAIAMSSLDMVEEVLSQSVATNERTMKGLNGSKGSAALSDPDVAAAAAMSAAATPPQTAVAEPEAAQETEEPEHETATATAAEPETVTVSHCSASDDGRGGGRGKTPAVETEEEGTQTDARRGGGGGGGGGGGIRRRASLQADGGSDALSDSVARNLMTTVPMQDNVHSLFTTSSAAANHRLPATAMPKEAKRIQLLPRAATSSSPPSPQSGVVATTAASVSPPPSRSSSGSPQVVPYVALAGRHLPPPSSASPENAVADAVAVAAGDAAATQFLHSQATGPLDVIPQLSRGSSASPAAAAGATGGLHALTQDRLWEDMVERAAAAAGVPQHEARRVLVSPASGAGEEEVRAFCEEGLGYGKLDATRLRVMWRRRAAAAGAASSAAGGGGGDAASAANQPPPRPQLALDGLWGEVHAALRGLDLREADLFAPLGAGGGEPDEGALADYFSFCREALNVSNMQALRLLTSWRSGAASASAREPPAAASDAPTPAPAVAAAAAAVSRGGSGGGGGGDPTDSHHHSPIVSPNRTRGSRGVPPPAAAHHLVDAAATPPSPPLPPRCSPCLSAVAPSSGAWATVVELLQGTAYVMDPFVAVSLHGIFAIEPLPGDIASFREECARVRARAAAATSADAGLWHPQGRLLYFNPPRGGGGGGGGGGLADGHYTSALPLTHAQLVDEADQRGYLPFTTGSPELGCGRCVRKTTRSVLLCEVVLGRLDAPVVKEGDPSGRTLAAGAEADALGVDYVYTRGGEEQVLLPPNDAARSPSPAPPGPRQMVGRQFLVREPRLVLPRYRVDVVVELHEPTPVRQHSPLRVRRSPTLPPQPAAAAAVAVTRAGSGSRSRSRSPTRSRSRSPPRAVYQAAQRATRSPSPPPSLPPATAALASMSPGGSGTSLRAPSPTRDAVEAAGSLIHLPLQRAVRSLYEGYDAVERGVSERLSAEKAAVAALRDQTLETTQAALRAKRHIKERIEAVEKLLECKKKELLGKVDEAEHSRKEELAQASAAKKKRSDELAALLDTLVEVKREKAAAAVSPTGGASVTHAVQAVQQLSVFREAVESDKVGAGGAAMNTTFLTVSSSNHSLIGGEGGATRHASAAFQPDYTLDLSGITRSIEELHVSAPGGLLQQQQQQPGSFLPQNPQHQPFLGQFESMLSGLSSSADTTPKALALMPPNATQPQPLTVGRSASLSAPQSALSLVPAMSRSVSGGGGGGDGGSASVNFKWVSSPLESPSTLASIAQSSTGAAGRKAWTAVMGDMASVIARAGASVFANAGSGLAIGKWSDALTVDASRLSGDRELFLSRKSNITTEWVVELRLEAGTAVELGVFVVGHTAAAEEEDRLVTLPQTLRYPAVVLARLTVRGGSRPPSLSLYHVHEGTGTEERLLTRSLSPFDLSFPFYVATVLRGPGEVAMVNAPVKRAD